MKVFEKIKIVQNGTVVKRYKLFGLPVLKKLKGEKVVFWFLGIRIFSKVNKKFPMNVNDSEAYRNKIIKNLRKLKHIVLWLDHSLGGGTETYSVNTFVSSSENVFFIRLQYFSSFETFVLSFPKSKSNKKLSFLSLGEVFKFLQNIKIKEIVVNNLVGYPDTTAVLHYVADFKQVNGGIKVSFRGHDFQSICPSFNLLNQDDKYCHLNYETGCENCLKNKKFAENEVHNKILRSGATTLELWRNAWNGFFENTLDEFIAFSEEIAKIFYEIYPQLKGKTRIVPHEVRDYPQIVIPQHKDINIAVLGNISLIQKGEKIIGEMCKYLEDYKDVNLKIVGTYKKRRSKLKITGKYDPQDLPSIMKKENIDLVFIPSIWPETFSYTTAEAMSMGLPVACFNLGAPYERVRTYEKGLIINKMDAKYALDEIVKFVKLLRRKK